MNPLVFKNLSEDTLLIEWPDQINPQVSSEISDLESALKSTKSPGIIECFPAYRSLSITFDPEINNAADLIDLIQNIDLKTFDVEKKTWELPVCYDPEVGKDLCQMAEAKNTNMEQIIQYHCRPTYHVHFFGFLPGFMYLGGLLKDLHHPRKSTPDRQIQSGSVAIGGSQTGIYPTSPGGWHVIGNCPVPLFDVTSNPPCFVEAGDKIIFQPISLEQHKRIKKEIAKGIFEINSLLNGQN
ncbi:MAG: 5-oxoprolinase subunit PxpB [Marinoscillum sp.]